MAGDSDRLKFLAIVPVPLIIAIIVILAFINPTLVFEPPFLLPTLNAIFLSLIPFIVAYLAWKSYVSSASLPMLFTGCGMVALGSGALVAGFTITIPDGTNLNVTIHNSDVLICAILLVAGALFALREATPYKSPKHGGLYIGLCYLAVLIFMSLFSLAALAGLVPPFFVQGAGPTVLRQVVLGVATGLFAVATIIFSRVYFRSRYDFTYWFSLALALITIGLCAVFIQKGVGTMVGWAGRTAQYLGCIYLLIGIISAVRLSKIKGTSLTIEISRSFGFIEANYKTLVEMASNAIMSVDNKGTILTWNPAAAKIFGYSVSEATGANVIDFIFPRESALLLNSELQKLARAKGQTAESGHKLELVARRKTGEDFPAEVSMAMKKVSGEWLGTFIIRDITERKRAEEALRESEERWQFALEGAGDGLWDWNAQTNQVYFSHKWKAMLGYGDDEIGNTLDEWDKRVHPDDLERTYAELNRHLEGRAPVYVSEHRVLCKDGTYKWILDRGKVISRTPEGKPLRVIGTHSDITERKKAAEALKESEEKYQSLFDNAEIALFRTRISDGKLIEINERYAQMAGYSNTENCLAEFNAADAYADPNTRKELLRILQEKGSVTDYGAEIIRRDGTRIWILFSATIFPEQGFLEGSIVDITERKRMEEALLLSQEKYRTLVEKAFEGIIVVHDRKIVFANPRVHEIIGYSRDQIEAMAFSDIVHPDDREAVIDRHLRRLKGDQIEEVYSIRLYDQQSNIKWAQASFALIDWEGKQAVLAFLTDITDLKRAEQAIRESEYKYRTLVETLQEGIWVIDKEGYTTYVNPRMAQMLGYTTEDMIGRPLFSFMLESAVANAKTNMERRAQGIKERHEFEFLRKDGSTIYTLLETGPLTDEKGNHIGAIAGITDITERKQAEEKLAESALQLVTSNKELRSALADKEVLLKEVHHRVKNNLMVISSLLNLQMRRTTDQEARESLRESDARIMSMAMIHEQVLRSGEYAAIDFTSYINDLLTNIRNSLAPYNQDVRLTVDVEPGIIIGLNQAVILGMIINEIASNSFKHAFQDCEKPEVSISCRRSEDQVQLSIKDNGVGIRDEVDVDDPSSLGIRLVNILVKQLDGTIKYGRDNGSKFTIMFRTKPESTEEVK